jgi:rhodanese-related sulfurtransferase
MTTAQTVSPAEVCRLRQSGQPVELIDVRTPAEFARLHADGARLVPLDQLDPRTLATATDDTPLYVICQSGARAAKAAEALRAAGRRNVFCVEGGTAAWTQAGLPVVRGTQRRIPSLERQVRIAAGALVLLGVLLGRLAHPAFYALSAFVGAGLVFAGLTDWCGMGLLLARMPWNTRADAGGSPAAPACPAAPTEPAARP